MGGSYVEPQPVIRPRPQKSRAVGLLARLSKRQRIAVAVASGMLFAFVLLSVILMLRTKDGTLVVELSDPNVTLQVLSEEGKVQIDRNGEKGTLEIAVDPGKHRLRLQKNGVEVFSQDFTLASGGKEIIRAMLKPLAPPPNLQSAAPALAIAPVDEKKPKEEVAAEVPGIIPKGTGGSSRHGYWFGYALGDEPGRWMPEVASYTNLVWDFSWELADDPRPQLEATLKSAEKYGLWVIIYDHKEAPFR